MKLYVYCVADREPRFVKPLVGLSNSEVGFLQLEDLWVGVSRLSGDEVTVSRENVLHHDAVIREVFSQVTVLPFRFGTLLPASRLQSYVRSRRQSLVERLSELRDCVEMSIKIIWRNPADSGPQPEPHAPALGEGTAFLLSRRERFLVDERGNLEARAVADWINDQLSEVVQKGQVSIQPKEKLLLSASYLIARGKETDFGQIVGKLTLERPDLHFLSSGPWPPYTFANIELEFETHFGVS